MTRGEIWWIDFGLAFPGMPQGRRPGLVVQNDNFTDVIQKGQRATKAHPYFIRSVDESHYETRFSYVFRH